MDDDIIEVQNEAATAGGHDKEDHRLAGQAGVVWSSMDALIVGPQVIEQVDALIL